MEKIVTIDCTVVKETPAAYLVDVGKTKVAAGGVKVPDLVWLPKSQCEWDEGDGEMQLPEWLAIEKGLV